MAGLFEQYGFYIAVILAGLLLYGIGNLLLGKKRHGGKRLVLLIAGGVMCASGAGILAACVFFGRDEANRIFIFLLAAFGLVLVVCGGRAVWLGFSSDSAKVEKAFDSLTDGL